MPLYAGWSGSKARLQCKPIRWLFCDEVRNYPPGRLEMVLKRTRSFWNSRRFLISTPGTKGDAMDTAYRAGDQRVWHFELTLQLFGERSDKLTPEEEAQMAEVAADLQDEAAQEPPLSNEVLEDQAELESGEADQPKDAPKRQQRRRRRHPLPEPLERQTVVIEPEGLAPCEHCGRPLQSIGQEVSEELEYVPAKLIVRRTVRPTVCLSLWLRRGAGGTSTSAPGAAVNAVAGGDVYLDFQGTRGRAAPQAQLTGFTRTIQTDAYEVYDSLKKVIPELRRIGCAAHAIDENGG